jgi:predicted nucleotidyltransferase component of viral defense system
MENGKFPIDNPRRLKDWVKNTAKKNNLVANTVLQNYMMERFLERVSVSKYRNNIILKGGFLIAAMVGIDMRSTMDMDTTIKGLPVGEVEIKKIVTEILDAPVNDNVSFEIKSIKPIHEIGGYEDFRLGIVATFYTMRVNLKLDITTGDVIIPREVDYSFKLMFEDRTIQVKAYNLNTILAEKIESILARNVANTRARDYYDVYLLLTTRAGDIDKAELLHTIRSKAGERGTTIYIEQHEKYLADIRESRDLLALWEAYRGKYPYAASIEFAVIVDCLSQVFK